MCLFKRRLLFLFNVNRNAFLVRRQLSYKLVSNLKERGLIESYFPDHNEIHRLFGEQQTFYAGFDPTAESLQIGNLLVLMGLLHCLRDGHRVICVIGDASARIGDPSDKTHLRPLLKESVIERNAENISSDINRVFSNHFKYFWKKSEMKKKPLLEPIILSNTSWYREMNFISFLSDIGRHIPVSELLRRNFVQNRLQTTGMMLSEFAYQAIQAYDWYYLYRRYNCKFQIGGNDQSGNVWTGYDLICALEPNRKHIPAYALLLKLLTSESGAKIGKSNSKQQIWLNRNSLSSFGFYQNFIQLPDSEVEKYLKLFTFYSLQEIESIVRRHFKNPEKRYAQKVIAENVTLLVHGEEGLLSAERATKALYEQDIDAFAKLDDRTLKEVFGEDLLTTMFLEPEETTVIDVVMKAKCFANSTDAVRTIEEGGFWLNNQRIRAPSQAISTENILENNTSLLRIGKRRYYIIKWA